MVARYGFAIGFAICSPSLLCPTSAICPIVFADLLLFDHSTIRYRSVMAFGNLIFKQWPYEFFVHGYRHRYHLRDLFVRHRLPAHPKLSPRFLFMEMQQHPYPEVLGLPVAQPEIGVLEQIADIQV